MEYRNTYNETFTLDEVLESMYLFYKQDPDSEYKIIVGSDSQKHKRSVTYITAAVIYRVGNGLKLFYSSDKVEQSYKIPMATRLLKEVEDSINLISKIEKSMLVELIGHDNLEVHIDAGHNGNSRTILSAAIGFVKGMGFSYKIKPESYVASHVADRFC